MFFKQSKRDTINEKFDLLYGVSKSIQLKFQRAPLPKLCGEIYLPSIKPGLS